MCEFMLILSGRSHASIPKILKSNNAIDKPSDAFNFQFK